MASNAEQPRYAVQMIALAHDEDDGMQTLFGGFRSCDSR